MKVTLWAVGGALFLSLAGSIGYLYLGWLRDFDHRALCSSYGEEDCFYCVEVTPGDFCSIDFFKVMEILSGGFAYVGPVVLIWCACFLLFTLANRPKGWR